MIENVEVVIENDNNLEIITACNGMCKKWGHSTLNGVVADPREYTHGESCHSNIGKARQMCKQTRS
jgi:hypothetical protein